jgi:ABC-2 type transport system permease protein
MTATLTTTAPAPTYRVRNVMRAEVAKLTSLSSTFWMMAVAVVGVLSTNSALHHSPDWYQGFDPTQTSLVGLLVPALLLGVFGALMVTSEYASGSIRVSLAATPRRPLFLAAKLAVAAAVTFAVSEIISFACFWLGQAVLSSGGAPTANLGQPGVARAVLMSGAFLGLLAMLSFGMGLIWRNTAGALAAFAGVAFVLPLILRAMPGRDWRYAPTVMLTNSVMQTVDTGGRLSPTAALVLMTSYTAAVLVAGVALFLRRDA